MAADHVALDIECISAIIEFVKVPHGHAAGIH